MINAQMYFSRKELYKIFFQSCRSTFFFSYDKVLSFEKTETVQLLYIYIIYILRCYFFWRPKVHLSIHLFARYSYSVHASLPSSLTCIACCSLSRNVISIYRATSVTGVKELENYVNSFFQHCWKSFPSLQWTISYIAVQKWLLFAFL